VSNARLELVEAAAYGALWKAARESARREGVEVLMVAGAVCTALAAAPGNTMINRVTGLGLHGAPSEAALDDIDAFFRAARTRYAIAVSPFAAPGLREQLAARGFEEGYAWMKFRRGVGPASHVETELRVDEIGPEHAEAFGSVVARGYGMPESAASWLGAATAAPGFRVFLAFHGDEPAAAAALFAGDGIGWLGLAATLPEHRRKGAQGALLAARIRAAIGAGVTELATETGKRRPDRQSNSYRNLLRSGFEEQYVRPNYLSPQG
jgi:hypothetical protein